MNKIIKKISEKDWIRINQSTCYLCKEKRIEKIEDIFNENFEPKIADTSIVFDLTLKEYWLWQLTFDSEVPYDYILYNKPIIEIKYCPICGRELKETTYAT